MVMCSLVLLVNLDELLLNCENYIYVGLLATAEMVVLRQVFKRFQNGGKCIFLRQLSCSRRTLVFMNILS